MRAALPIVLLLALAGTLRAATFDLVPSRRTAFAQHAWQTNNEMAFALPAQSKAGAFYVRISYRDDGKGLLRVSYRSPGGKEINSTDHTRSSRVGTGGWVNSFHKLLLAKGNTGGVLLIRLLEGGGVPLELRRVTGQDTPFEDRQFRTALSEPWRQPLHFVPPLEHPAPTLKQRVMVGYQGWFRTPNDRDDNGWLHWFHSLSDPSPPFYTVDMWPDTQAYHLSDRVRAGDLTTRDGQPATLFSSTAESVVRHHFWWMRRNGIDGAFVQRFLNFRRGGDDGVPEWVLWNVRKAANAEGRLWAVEYDVSGMPPDKAYAALKRDWTWLSRTLKVTGDPYYARENGKPVVFIWGLSFPSHHFTPGVANRIVDYFQRDGNNVIGSLPNTWKGLSGAWLRHARRYDGLQVWQTQDYAADQQAFDRWGIAYYPHVWPGFSWSHLTRKPGGYSDRAGGAFYRGRIAQAFKAGCDRLFVGMFDEYDEGTAIMPMSDDPPPPNPPWGRFVTNNGVPATHWLKITAEARRALQTPAPLKAFTVLKPTERVLRALKLHRKRPRRP